MLIIPVKEGESIEKALKKFKRKVEKTGLIKKMPSHLTKMWPVGDLNID